MAIAFSPDGKTLLTGGNGEQDFASGEARLWSAVTGRSLSPPLKHRRIVVALAFSPDGKTVLTGSDDQTARLWSADTGLAVGPPLKHQGAVRAVAFSPDGKTVLSGSDDHTARLWSAETGQPVGPPFQHQRVDFVAFCPNGKAVLTGSKSGKTVRLWSVATGHPLGPPCRHHGVVHTAAFSPNGQTVATGSKEENARLWSVPRPLEGDRLRVKRWAEVITGAELDGHGVVRAFNTLEWAKRRQELAALGGPPLLMSAEVESRNLKAAVEHALAWHEELARNSIKSRQWYAFSFHMERSKLAQLDVKKHHELWGRANAEQGNYQKAAAHFAEAIRHNSADSRLHAFHILALLAMNDIPGFRRGCEHFLDSFGQVDHIVEHPTLFIPCILTADALRRPERLVQLAEQAVERQPRRATCIGLLGLSLYRAGRFEEAVKRLQEAIRVHAKGGNPMDWVFLAMAYQRLDKPAQAKAWLKKYTDYLDKSAEEVQSLLWGHRFWLPFLRHEAEALVK
jgi:tetratricopeptide (TPR) repeat protein